MGQPVPLSLPHAVPLEALGTRRQSPLSHVPREGGDPEASRTDRWLALIWIPAFAGNVVEREGMKPPTPASPVLPPLGEDLLFLDLPPLGEVARSAEGGLVSFFRLPREGGDPDRFTQTENGPLAHSLY